MITAIYNGPLYIESLPVQHDNYVIWSFKTIQTSDHTQSCLSTQD